MNYVLTSNFLYKSSSCTSIQFIKSEEFDVYEDSNSRSLIVHYVENSRYSDLTNYINIQIRSDSNIVDGLINLRLNTETVINGVRYYISNKYELLSCILINRELDNIIYSDYDTLNIFYNSLNRSEYLEFINKSPDIFAEIVDESKFIIANFNEVNLKLPFNRTFNNQVLSEYKEFSINESMVVTAFINTIKEKFPDFTIAPELNKRFVRNQKHKIMIYESKLASHGVEFSTHVRKSPDRGRYAQIENDMTIEILTDDIDTYIYIRDLLLMGAHIFLVTTFILVDIYGREWSYTVEWSDNELSNDFDRGPSSKYFDETILYSIKLNAKLFGKIVEKFRIFPRIQKCINLLYTKVLDNPREIIQVETDIKPNQMTVDLEVGLEVDYEYTQLLYIFGNTAYRAGIDKITGEFIIVLPDSMPYRGVISKSTGKLIFNDRILNGEKLPFDEGKLLLRTKSSNLWINAYHVVAEIVKGKSEYDKIKEFYRFGSNAKDYYLLSINQDLLTLLENNFSKIYNGNNIRIISYKSELNGLTPEGFPTNNSGSTFEVENYWNYDLFMYSNGELIRIKKQIVS